MTTQLADPTPRTAARIAGIGYIVLFVLAIFANFLVFDGLVESGDAAATAANIADSEGLFRLGVVAFLIVFIVDVVVAWALWVLFRDVARELSRLTAWMRIVYTVFLGVALVFSLVAVQLIGGAAYLGAFDQGQIDAQVMLMLDAFTYAWLIGLAAFGFHLILLGYMVLATGAAPRVLGIVLAIAGTAYAADTVAHALLSNYTDYENLFLALVAIPSIVGELWFTVWLLTRGGRQPATA
jgi:hypothetical protein